MSAPHDADTQFQLANERTYLAWLRTALGLVAAGVGAARLLSGDRLHWAWEAVGVLLILAGIVTAGSARRRWKAVDAAVHEGRRIPPPGVAVLIAAIIVVAGLVAIGLLLWADGGN
jgi:putative membrane protein